MFDLLEKILRVDERISREPYWLDDKGDLIKVKSTHSRDVIFRRMPPKGRGGEYVTYGKIGPFMEGTNWIRISVSSDMSQITADVGSYVNRPQLRILKKLDSEYETFWYDITKNDKSVDSGEGYENFVASLEKFRLLNESSIDFPRSN